MNPRTPTANEVGDDLDSEIKEALRNLVHRARRCVPKVGTDEFPTEWDRRHGRIDELLDDLRCDDAVEPQQRNEPEVPQPGASPIPGGAQT